MFCFSVLFFFVFFFVLALLIFMNLELASLWCSKGKNTSSAVKRISDRKRLKIETGNSYDKKKKKSLERITPSLPCNGQPKTEQIFVTSF